MNPVGMLCFDRFAGNKRGTVVEVRQDSPHYVVADSKGRRSLILVERALLKMAKR